MKTLLIEAGVKYGASKADATTNTALTPDLLAVGAIGVYGMLATGKITLITNTATGTGMTPVATFRGGALTFADGTGSSGTIAGTVTAAIPTGTTHIMIAQGTTPGYIGSDWVDYKSATRTIGVEYTAPVKGVITITTVPVASPSATDQYTIGIVDSSTPDKEYRTYTVTGSYASATLLNAAFITKINADENPLVVATGTTTLILTDYAYGLDIEANVSQELLGNGIVYTTSPAPGSGYGPNVLKLEKNIAPYRGFLNKADGFITQATLYTAIASNYDMYFINLTLALDNQNGFSQVHRPKREVIAAFPDRAASTGDGQTDFDAIFLGFWGTTSLTNKVNAGTATVGS